MIAEPERPRRMSAAIFGNEKVAEVVVALDGIGSPATAQELSKVTGIGHSMVRDVLLRLSKAGIVSPLPRIGGTRSALYFAHSDDEAWDLMRRLAALVLHDELPQLNRAPGRT